eukprot:1145381-Pelagomonas_calceolata.AAC.2
MDQMEERGWWMEATTVWPEAAREQAKKCVDERLEVDDLATGKHTDALMNDWEWMTWPQASARMH